VVEPQSDGRYIAGRSVPVVLESAGSDLVDIDISLMGQEEPTPVAISLTEGEEETWSGQTPPLKVSGLYTLTIRRTSDVGRGVLLRDEASVTFRVEPRKSRSLWALLAGLLALGLFAGGLWWRSRSRPVVEGVLRLVQGPDAEQSGRTWDLGQWRSKSVSVGSSTGCDIVLANDPEVAPQTAVIQAELDAQGHVKPVLSVLNGGILVRVNGQPIPQVHRLGDGDTVQIGSYDLCYENLELRWQSLAWQPESVVHQMSHTV
jgi:hypothetical protein